MLVKFPLTFLDLDPVFLYGSGSKWFGTKSLIFTEILLYLQKLKKVGTTKIILNCKYLGYERTVKESHYWYEVDRMQNKFILFLEIIEHSEKNTRNLHTNNLQTIQTN